MKPFGYAIALSFFLPLPGNNALVQTNGYKKTSPQAERKTG